MSNREEGRLSKAADGVHDMLSPTPPGQNLQQEHFATQKQRKNDYKKKYWEHSDFSDFRILFYTFKQN